MKYIYEPKGRAGEYSPLALNIYNGCDHGCVYCYVPDVSKGQFKTSQAIPRKMVDEELYKESALVDHQVLLSFLGDPYCHADVELERTRKILFILKKNKVPVAILSKGGKRMLRDLDLFKQFDQIKVGQTITFLSDVFSKKWEPKASTPIERIEVFRELHDAGIRTWASVEPVISAPQTMAIIEAVLPYVDEFMLGKLNHMPRIEQTINWDAYGRAVIGVLKRHNKPFYVKDDLRRIMERTGFRFSEEETDPMHLTLKRSGLQKKKEKKDEAKNHDGPQS